MEPESPPTPMTAPDSAATGSSQAAAAAPGEREEPGTAELLEQLRDDRLWLLRQLDSGRWTRWRLDLAALERELGLLLEQAAERLDPR